MPLTQNFRFCGTKLENILYLLHLHLISLTCSTPLHLLLLLLLLTSPLLLPWLLIFYLECSPLCPLHLQFPFILWTDSKRFSKKLPPSLTPSSPLVFFTSILWLLLPTPVHHFGILNITFCWDLFLLVVSLCHCKLLNGSATYSETHLYHYIILGKVTPSILIAISAAYYICGPPRHFCWINNWNVYNITA